MVFTEEEIRAELERRKPQQRPQFTQEEIRAELERRRRQSQPQFTPEMLQTYNTVMSMYSDIMRVAQAWPTKGTLAHEMLLNRPDYLDKPGPFASSQKKLIWKASRQWESLTSNEREELEREFDLDRQLRVANIPGWSVGGIARVKEAVPVIGATVVHSVADIPNLVWQQVGKGPQFGKFDEEFEHAKPLYKLPYSIFADPSARKKGEVLLKREVKVAITKDMILPWLTLFTGETGVDQDPVKASGIVQKWAKDGLITPETAEELMGFRTFGKYWQETPEMVALDVALFALPAAKIPLAGLTKLGKFGRAVKAGRAFLKEAQFAKGAPLSASTKTGFKQVSAALEAYRRGLATWDEVMDSTAVNQWLWESTDVSSKLLLDYGPGAFIEPVTFGERAFTWAAKTLERAPLKWGAVTVPRQYSTNPAFFALQKTTEKLRASYAPADSVMGWTERLVGLAPEQRMVDYFIRTLPQEALPALRPIADKIRTATKKVPRNEWEAFVDALEVTTPEGRRWPIKPETMFGEMKRVPPPEPTLKFKPSVEKGPYAVRLSKPTVAALHEWKRGIKVLEEWYRDRGLEVSRTDAAWTTRAKVLFEVEKKKGGMDAKKIDAAWAALEPDEVMRWRYNAKREFNQMPTVEEWIANAKKNQPGWYQEYIDMHWRRWVAVEKKKFDTLKPAPTLEQAQKAYRADVSKGIPKKKVTEIPTDAQYFKSATDPVAQSTAWREFVESHPLPEGEAWYKVDNANYFPHWEKPKGFLERLAETTDSIFRTRGIVPRTEPSHLKFRAGTRDFLKNPKIAAEMLIGELEALEMERIVIAELNDLRPRNAKTGMPTVLRGNQKVPNGYVAYNPSLRLKVGDAQVKMLEGVTESLRRGEDMAHALWEGFRKIFPDEESIRNAVKPGDTYLLPQSVANRYKAHFGMTALGPRAIRPPLWWKTHTNAWKNSMLVGMFYSRWMLNNFVGNVAMGILDGSIWRIPQAHKWRLSKEMQEVIPANLGGGGFAEAVRGKANLNMYDTATKWGKAQYGGAWLLDTLYKGNTIVDDLVRTSSFIKRIMPQLEKQMILNGYKGKPGAYFMDNVGKLTLEETAGMLRGMRKADPRLFSRIGLDVSRNVYDFGLKTPLEKLMSAYTHPFISWWKFQNAWVMGMLVQAPEKIALMNVLGRIGQDINRAQWAAFGYNPDRVPEEYRNSIPVEVFKDEDGNEKMRFLTLRGANFLNEVFSFKPLVSGLHPTPKYVGETLSRRDFYREAPISSPYWQYAGKTAEKAVPEEYRDNDQTLWHYNRVWSLFTDVVPYGNIGEFVYKINRPYAEHPTASPFIAGQPYLEGTKIAYEYENNWETLLLRVLGIPLQAAEIRTLKKKFLEEKKGVKQIKRKVTAWERWREKNE